MGAGASQGFVEAADDKELEMPDAPEHLQALASRLSKAHGVAEAIICQGLVALEPCVQRRLNRRITKPLDLACLRAFKAEMEGRDVAPDVRAALDQLPDKAKVEALLDSLHLCGGYLPRIGLGSGGLYKHFEEAARPHDDTSDNVRCAGENSPTVVQGRGSDPPTRRFGAARRRQGDFLLAALAHRVTS